MQASDIFGGRDFLHEKVSSKPWQADNESEERIG